ncbi:hypothetical protein [Arthrobacter sp. L77]|uniref:hypothetical protein n=1 Tax=Arthrobacter sp. L77 TaxID=1496689 RepID=UPI0005BBF167|nr:hypothetical protein [Arthrobacter sp. L77]
MKPFEVTVEGELFRISERRQPSGALSYDIAWLNGPAERTYVFTVGKFTVGSGGHTSDAEARMTDEELLGEVRGFVLSGRVGESGGA